MMFKQTLFCLFFLQLSILALADDSVSLTITVTGVTPGQGQVVVSLFEDEETYFKKPLKVLRQGVTDSDSVELLIEDLQAGDYAVSVFYDEDNDGELDTGMFRIPKEPVGSSNNARGKFGPPKWKNAQFDLDRDMRITIQVADAI